MNTQELFEDMQDAQIAYEQAQKASKDADDWETKMAVKLMDATIAYKVAKNQE